MRVPIFEKLRKFWKNLVKSAVFEAENPLEMGPDFQNFLKNLQNQPFFEWKKILDKGKGFERQAAHPIKK